MVFGGIMEWGYDVHVLTILCCTYTFVLLLIQFCQIFQEQTLLTQFFLAQLRVCGFAI